MDDDMERLDRAMEVLRRRAQEWEAAELSRMETTLSQTTPPAIYRDVPPPGFCHPYHEKHKRAIIDWLDGESNIGGGLELLGLALLGFSPEGAWWNLGVIGAGGVLVLAGAIVAWVAHRELLSSRSDTP